MNSRQASFVCSYCTPLNTEKVPEREPSDATKNL